MYITAVNYLPITLRLYGCNYVCNNETIYVSNDETI